MARRAPAACSAEAARRTAHRAAARGREVWRPWALDHRCWTHTVPWDAAWVQWRRFDCAPSSGQPRVGTGAKGPTARRPWALGPRHGRQSNRSPIGPGAHIWLESTAIRPWARAPGACCAWTRGCGPRGLQRDTTAEAGTAAAGAGHRVFGGAPLYRIPLCPATQGCCIIPLRGVAASSRYLQWKCITPKPGCRLSTQRFPALDAAHATGRSGPAPSGRCVPPAVGPGAGRGGVLRVRRPACVDRLSWLSSGGGRGSSRSIELRPPLSVRAGVCQAPNEDPAGRRRVLRCSPAACRPRRRRRARLRTATAQIRRILTSPEFLLGSRDTMTIILVIILRLL